MEVPYGVPLPSAEPPAPRRRRWVVPLALLLIVALIATLLIVGRTRTTPREARGPATLARLSAETEALRELRFRRPVNPEYLTSDELAQEVRDAVASEDLATGLPDAVVLDALGVIEEPEDLRPILTEASAGGVVGFYDPETKRLVVESSGGEELSPLAQTTLVHELTHALGDQHFDLGGFLTGEEPADELTARTAVAEGDATLTMNLWQARHLSFSDQLSLGFEAAGDVGSLEQLQRTPAAITQIMIAPYVDGLAFVQSLHDAGGWAAVNEAYRKPPVTTEQVLHPEVYRAGDTGETVPPPDAPAGATREAGGQIGELFLRALLGGDDPFALLGLGSDDGAAAAAAGWDGGSYAVLSGGGGHTVVMDVRWDTPQDADEFATALLASEAADPAESGWACLRVDRSVPARTLVRVFETRCPAG